MTRPECADTPTDWRLAGLCRDWDLQAVDRLWFADVDEDPQAVEVATVICQSCPVRNRCAEASRDDLYGVFGGIPASDRVWLMIKATPEVAEVHGTRGRYNAGCSCVLCKAANTEYVQSWRQRPPVTSASSVSPMPEQLTLALTS